MHAASILLLAWAMIGAACFFPAAGAIPVGSVLAVLVAVVGLPHGAADHRFARPRLEPLLGAAWAAVFLAGYLAIAAVVVGGWFLAPAATILVFFLASAWHFGQEEPDLAIVPGRQGRGGATAGFGGPQPSQTAAVRAVDQLQPGRGKLFLRAVRFFRPVFRFARGGLVIWVPVAVQTDEVVRILALTAPRGFGPEIHRAVAVLVPCSWLMLASATVGWAWQAFSAMESGVGRRRVLLLDNFMVASLVVLFAVANPVVGFLVYFCGWHSARGLRRLRRQLGESWPQLAVSLAPMTVLALCLVALATCLVLRAPTWNDTLIRATFVGLSSVALPHLVLHGAGPAVDQLGRTRLARALGWEGAA